LAPGSGSLLEVHFAVRGEATAGNSASVDLVQVRLNEGAIAPNPEPMRGPDSTDGRIAVAASFRSPGQQASRNVAAIAIQQRRAVERPLIPVARTLAEADSPSTFATAALPLGSTTRAKMQHSVTHAENNAPESSPGQAASIALASVFSRPKRPASVDLLFSTPDPWAPNS
jgi:hypothetical protein